MMELDEGRGGVLIVKGTAASLAKHWGIAREGALYRLGLLTLDKELLISWQATTRKRIRIRIKDAPFSNGSIIPVSKNVCDITPRPVVRDYRSCSGVTIEKTSINAGVSVICQANLPDWRVYVSVGD
jgi:hypothetical protein